MVPVISNLSWLSWIIFGALAGWIASILTGNNSRMGCLSNIIVEPLRFEAQRALLSTATALVIEGELQEEGGAVSIRGRRFFSLSEVCAAPSHDFH